VADGSEARCDASQLQAALTCAAAVAVPGSCRRSEVERYLFTDYETCFTRNHCDGRWVATCEAKVSEVATSCGDELLRRIDCRLEEPRALSTTLLIIGGGRSVLPCRSVGLSPADAGA
jgi:hypothetical protein